MEKELREYVTRLLLEIGYNPGMLGFQYAREAILYWTMKSKGFPIKISLVKDIYEHVAKDFDTTSSRAERCIRHCVQKSYLDGDLKKWEQLFGCSVSLNRENPTNMQFIRRLVDLTIEKKQELLKKKGIEGKIHHIDFQRMRM